ncbi:MAG: hypothetical protein JWP44_644 [Mucilaginibacter sp.]|nr:hypothetical protein [Mucilaginibacter sp.]
MLKIKTLSSFILMGLITGLTIVRDHVSGVMENTTAIYSVSN